ncbi:MAG TPA: Holliday junction branch migration protein RuvA [Candidatus Methanoperedens sp.]
MISHIYGEIAYRGDGFVVIDVGGLGYHVNVTKPVLQELSNKKEKVKLFTYLNVREDALILYGFTGESDLEMFKLLISVTRIGPQIALSIMSQIKLEELVAAIIHEDEKVLTRISGVGQKNAKRLILELRDKIKKKMGERKMEYPQGGNINYDAVSALVSLGFQQRQAQEAVDSVLAGNKQITVEALVKEALSKLRQ